MNRKYLLLLCGMILATLAHAQEGLYHRWLGPQSADVTIVFIHGGPGYNCASFEADMAPRLAKMGYQVLVYDQRGCGRSESAKGEFTYAEAVEDLLTLLNDRDIPKAVLFGHSFGGSVAVEFASAHPDRTKGILLISAPLDFPACFRAIRHNCWIEMEERGDETGLNSLRALAAMDSTKLEYATTHFAYAMSNGLYAPSEYFKSAEKVQKVLKKPDWAKWVKHSSFAPVQGFWKNEQYTTNNRMDMLRAIPDSIPVAGIYGEEDGLFDQPSLDQLEDAIGTNNFYVMMMASHAVFADDPYGFLDAMGEFFSREIGMEE